MFAGFYKDRRVLVTGHTGFKGSWLSLWLKELGAAVGGIALDPPTNPSLYELVKGHAFAADVRQDVRDVAGLTSALRTFQPEVVFHLAAQPLVRRSYTHPLETFEVNAGGTANLLEAVRSLESACTVVVVTTDKVYENREWELAYRENDALGGHDVYSMSKAAAELVTSSWRSSFFSGDTPRVRIATARAGNVIGGGDYAEDRIVPDCIRSLLAGERIRVRNPGSTRPWQHVLESLSGYLWLAARVSQSEGAHLCTAFNFGPNASSNRTVRDVVEQVMQVWPGKWTDARAANQPHEAGRLSLAIEKSGVQLSWLPVWEFQTTIEKTITWYHERHVQKRSAMIDYSIQQMRSYADAAALLALPWAVSA